MTAKYAFPCLTLKSKECRISYWDALIVSAAEKCGCHEIVTEDLSDGQLYRGMMAVNPFVLKGTEK